MVDSASAPVAVITGASSGIGKEAAKALAGRGWRVVALGRDAERCAAAEREIRAASTGPRVDMIVADLAMLRDAARAAAEIASLTDKVHVLLNNAGGVSRERWITPEGNEGTFAGNHLGPFLLTDRLLPILRAAALDAPAGTVRIINTSSVGHERAPGFDWNDLQMIDGWITGQSYCNAKLANILVARALAARLAPDGIIAHAMHPGVVHSNFVAHADDAMAQYMSGLDGQTPAEAAETLTWLATAAEPGRSSGKYYYHCAEVDSSAMSHDALLGERLWAESVALIEKANV